MTEAQRLRALRVVAFTSYQIDEDAVWVSLTTEWTGSRADGPSVWTAILRAFAAQHDHYVHESTSNPDPDLRAAYGNGIAAMREAWTAAGLDGEPRQDAAG